MSISNLGRLTAIDFIENYDCNIPFMRESDTLRAARKAFDKFERRKAKGKGEKKARKSSGHRTKITKDPLREQKTSITLPLAMPYYPGRTRVDRESNFTASRVNEAEDHYCMTDLNSASSEASHLKSRIVDHAYRRVQIFYYQLLAYYGEGCEISQGKTELQHGMSLCPECHAAHSSIFSSLNDTAFETLKLRLRHEGMTQENLDRLSALGFSQGRIQRLKKSLKPRDIKLAFLGLESHQLIAPSTQLYHSMNSTVEVPKEVDYFDQIIEKNLRPVGLQLLNQVSREEMHPYDALTLFVEKLQGCMLESISELKIKQQKLNELRRVEEQMQTLEASIESMGNAEFFQSYLRLYVQRQNCLDCLAFESQFSFSFKMKEYLPSHKAIFTRLASICKNEKEWALKQFKHPRFMYQYIQEVRQRYKRITDTSINPMHILEEVEANYSLKAMQDAVVAYWNSCDLYELTIQRFSHKKYEYGLFLRESLEGISKPMYSDFNDENTVIQEALAIAQEQLRGSQLPPLELLSGRKEGSARVPLDEAALRQQKFALLRREYDVHYVREV